MGCRPHHYPFFFFFFEPWLSQIHQVIEDGVGHLFMKTTLITKARQVELERFQVYAGLVRNVRDLNRCKVWLTSQGTETGEFGTVEMNFKIPLGTRIGKTLEVSTGLG